VEAGSPARGFAAVDLSALVADLPKRCLLAEDTGRTLERKLAAGRRRVGDRQLLAQAIINLAENAMRHTPPGTTIRLAADAMEPTMCCCASATTAPASPPRSRACAAPLRAA
jgi:signal transduction histidine kinase